MDINKSLKVAAEKNPSKKSLQMTIKEILENVEKKIIVLPQYQTDVRWTLEKSVELLNYQMLASAPVAPLSMNYIIDERINEVEQISFIDRCKIAGSVAYKYSTTDGQQRITANLKAYMDSSDFKAVVLDLIKGEFIVLHTEKGESPNEYQMPVGKLLNKEYAEFENYALSQSVLKENFPLLFMIRNKMHTYNYIINVAEDLNKSQQLKWFEVLNNAGTKIPQVQVNLTSLTSRGIDIFSEYTIKFKKILDENGYKGLIPQKNAEVSTSIATLNPFLEKIKEKKHSLNWSVIPSDVKESEIINIETDKLRYGFDVTLKGLNKSIEFIKKNNLAVKRVEYLTYLTGVYVINDLKDLDKDQANKVIHWCKDTDFNNKSNSDRRKMYNKLIKLIVR